MKFNSTSRVALLLMGLFLFFLGAIPGGIHYINAQVYVSFDPVAASRISAGFAFFFIFLMGLLFYVRKEHPFIEYGLPRKLGPRIEGIMLMVLGVGGMIGFVLLILAF